MFSLVTHKSITEDDDPRQLHYLFYQQIDPQVAGQYRTQEVIITGSRYPVAAPSTIASEMQKLKTMDAKARQLSPCRVCGRAASAFCVYSPL